MNKALHASCMAGDVDKADALINEGANVDMTVNTCPLIHWVASIGRAPVMMLLLNRGAHMRPHTVSLKHKKHLLTACTAMPAVCFELARLGADMEALDASGRTPLAAACEGFLAVSTLPLIALGANMAHYLAYNTDMLEASRLKPAQAAVACGMTRQVLKLLDASGSGKQLNRVSASMLNAADRYARADMKTLIQSHLAAASARKALHEITKELNHTAGHAPGGRP